VHAVLTERLEEAMLAIQAFFDAELAALNERLRTLGRPAIISE
jgi:hypothetical protein